MAGRHNIVIVAQNPVLLTTLVSWVEAAGYQVAAARSFKEGRVALEKMPAVLITELKLGEYNGLHLSLRARTAGVPSVVIGPDDPVLIRDADELGAIYLTPTIHRHRILDLLAEHTEPSAENGENSRFSWKSEFERAVGRRRHLALN